MRAKPVPSRLLGHGLATDWAQWLRCERVRAVEWQITGWRAGGVAEFAGEDLEKLVTFQNGTRGRRSRWGRRCLARFGTTIRSRSGWRCLWRNGNGCAGGAGADGDGVSSRAGDGVVQYGSERGTGVAGEGNRECAAETLGERAREMGATKLGRACAATSRKGWSSRARKGSRSINASGLVRKVDGFDASGFDDSDVVAAKVGVQLVPYGELAKGTRDAGVAGGVFSGRCTRESRGETDILRRSRCTTRRRKRSGGMYFGEKSFLISRRRLWRCGMGRVGSTITT